MKITARTHVCAIQMCSHTRDKLTRYPQCQLPLGNNELRCRMERAHKKKASGHVRKKTSSSTKVRPKSSQNRQIKNKSIDQNALGQFPKDQLHNVSVALKKLLKRS